MKELRLSEFLIRGEGGKFLMSNGKGTYGWGPCDRLRIRFGTENEAYAIELCKKFGGKVVKNEYAAIPV